MPVVCKLLIINVEIRTNGRIQLPENTLAMSVYMSLSTVTNWSRACVYVVHLAWGVIVT